MNRLRASPLIGRALDVAEKRLGIEELCHRLIVPESTIRSWRAGHVTMPEFKFQRLVDILLEIEPRWIDWDEAQPPKKTRAREGPTLARMIGRLQPFMPCPYLFFCANSAAARANLVK